MKQSLLDVILTNGMAFVLLLMIYVNSILHKNNLTDQKLYHSMILFIMASLVLEVITVVVDGTQFFGSVFVNRFVNFLLFSINPISAVLWACYADYKIFADIKRIKKRLPLFVIPAAINFVLCFLTLFFDIMFKIDQNNVYFRTPFIWYTFAVAMFYMAYVVVLLLKNRKKTPKSNFYPMLFFPLPVLIGALIQLLNYGVVLIWTGCAFSIILLNFHVQNEMLKTDYLTNLPNRLWLDSYIKMKINRDEGKTLVGLMVDIDYFKYINDTYGHKAGDNALITLGQIFKNSVGFTDFVARYGGDEFVFILSNNCDGDKVIKKLKNNVAIFNENSNLPYKLEFSVGMVSYNITEQSTLDDFYKHLDAKMYDNKKTRKQLFIS